MRVGAASLIVLFCASAGALAAASFASVAGDRTRAPQAGGVHQAQFFDERLFALGIRDVESAPAQAIMDGQVLVVPHHLTAAPLILGPLRDLAAGRNVRRVILVGPNHTNSGGAAFITSAWAWYTPFGEVSHDAPGIAHLVDAGAGVEPGVISAEHSVAGIVPAIRYAMPEATIVPLIIKRSVTPDGLAPYVAAIGGLMDRHTVLVVAVDFSHGLPLYEALSRNDETIAVIDRMASHRLFDFGNEHLDSPASIALAIEVARALGADRFETIASATSADYAPGVADVTSYVVGYFH